MRYSVIVPVYNAADYLEACISSVLVQQVQDWELILVDDGSADASGSIADSWAERDPRIRVLHQENLGQFFARQAGIAASRGEYLLFLDADDKWETDCLSTLDNVIAAQQPDLVLFAGRIYKNDADTGRIIGQVFPEPGNLAPEKLRESLLLSHDLNSLCLKAFRRTLFLHDSEDYSVFEHPCLGEDKVRLLVPATRVTEIICIPDVLYQYHHREDSVVRNITSDSVERMLANEMFTLLRRYQGLWGMDTPTYRNQLDAYYLRNWLSVYFGLRKTAKTVQEHYTFRKYPWKKVTDSCAFHAGAVYQLSWRDRLRMFAAILRL